MTTPTHGPAFHPEIQFTPAYHDHVPYRKQGGHVVLDTATRMRLAKQGRAMPDGSWPIRDATDLHHAIEAFGRAKDAPAVRSWIMRRAAELGLKNLLPVHWLA